MLRQSGALVAVLGPSNERGVEIAAGRLLERLWIDLNEQDIAVHPYYVLSDQLYRLREGLVPAELRPQVVKITERVAELLKSRDNTIFMLLRIGVPKTIDPVRSRRLSLESLLNRKNL